MKLFLDIFRDMSDSARYGSVLKRLVFGAFSLVPSLVLYRRIRRFDSAIPRLGLARAASMLYRRFYRCLHVNGRPPLLPQGLLYAANHPGVGDSLALLSQIGSRRLRIVVKDRQFFRLLPNLCKQLVFVGGDSQSRKRAVAEVASHLRAGGDVLIFPGGNIEPDPALVRTAAYTAASSTAYTTADSTEARSIPWSRLPDILSRNADRQAWSFSLVSVSISQVFQDWALDHWFSRRGRTREIRESRAAYLGLLFPHRSSGAVNLRFSPTLSSSDLATGRGFDLRAFAYQELVDTGENFVPGRPGSSGPVSGQSNPAQFVPVPGEPCESTAQSFDIS